ncbi:hypothetical protein FRC01_007293, partial [Tulasnella sp. 417]
MPGPGGTNTMVGQPQTPLATINNVPIEVFYSIILLVTLQGQVEGYYDRLRTLRLVAASWSALIDDYPQCWSIISSSQPESIWRMALQKSQSADIDVDSGSIDVPKHHQTRLVEAIVDHMQRVRKLSILDRDLEYLIASAPTAPRLRSLHLRRGLDDEDSIALSIHPAQWAPNLRDVDLYCSRLIWKEPLWNSLERLRIQSGGWAEGLPMEGISTVLQASPGLRILSLTGILRPTYQRTLPVVRLDALENLKLDTPTQSSPLEVLNSIVALPSSCAVYFDAEDESRRREILRSVYKLVPQTANDVEGANLLKFAAGIYGCRFRIEGFDVLMYSETPGKVDPLETFTHVMEGLPAQRCSAVKSVEIYDTDFACVLGLLPIVSSFCRNTSDLTIPALNDNLATAIGGTSNGWLFSRLESISVSRYWGGHHAVKVAQFRLQAFEAGRQVAKLKKITLSSFRLRKEDELELAKLQALVPELVVTHP